MFQKENNEKDISLVLAWQKGNTTAIEKLLDKYMPLIMKAAANNYASSDFEDVRQNLIVAFLESTQSYIPKEDIPFAAYIQKKILWARTDTLQKVQQIESNEFLNLEEKDEPHYEMEWNCLSTPMLNDIAAIAQLTPKQRQIYPLWINGKTVKEIHTHLGISERSIQQILVRLKEALRSHAHEIEAYLKENY